MLKRWPSLTQEQQEHAALLAAAARRPTTVILSHGRQRCVAVGLESGNFDPLLLLVLPLPLARAARQAGAGTHAHPPPQQLVHLHTFMAGIIRQHPAAFASVIARAPAADTPAVITAQQMRRLCCSLLRVRERQQHKHQLRQQPHVLVGCGSGCSSQGWTEFPTLHDYLVAVTRRAGTAQLKGQQLWLHQPSLQPGAAVPCSAEAAAAAAHPTGDLAQAAQQQQQQQQQRQQRQCASCQMGLNGSWLACTIAQCNSKQGSYVVRFDAGPCKGETARVPPGLCTVHLGPEPPACTHCLSAPPAAAAAAAPAAADAQPASEAPPPASSGEGRRGRLQRQKRAAQGPPLPPRQQQQKRKRVVTKPQQPGQLPVDPPTKLQQTGKEGQAAKQQVQAPPSQALAAQLPPPPLPAAADASAADAGSAAAAPPRPAANDGERMLPLLLKPPLECSSADIAAALQLVHDALGDGHQQGQPSLMSALQARQSELVQQLWYSQLAHACARDDVPAVRMVLAQLVD